VLLVQLVYQALAAALDSLDSLVILVDKVSLGSQDLLDRRGRPECKASLVKLETQDSPDCRDPLVLPDSQGLRVRQVKEEVVGRLERPERQDQLATLVTVELLACWVLRGFPVHQVLPAPAVRPEYVGTLVIQGLQDSPDPLAPLDRLDLLVLPVSLARWGPQERLGQLDRVALLVY